MKSPELTEFFSLLGKAKKEKKEEFDNLLKEADINLDVLASTVVTGIKEVKVNEKKQKKKEEKLIEQLDSIIDTIEKPKEVKDFTEPPVTVGVPEDFDVSKLEEEDPLHVQDWNNGEDIKFTEVDAVNIIEPEPIKTPEISDTVAQAIKFIEETNIKEEVENADETSVEDLKAEIKQVRDILYKVLAHGPGSGEVNLLKLDDVDEDSAKVDGKVLQYQASSGKFIGGSASGIGTQDSLNTSGIITASSFVGDLTGDVTGTASNATLSVNAQGLTGTPNITVGSVNASSGTFSGNVDISGVLTYEDVTNVDSIGVITARSGIKVGSGITLSPDGDGFFTGVTTSITSSVIGSNTSPLTIGAVSSHHLTVANDNASMILGKSNSDALYLRRNFVTGRYVFQTFNGGNDGSIALQPFGGKVGIASAIPTSTLDVNGDVRVGSGITLSPDGDIFATGVSTSTKVHVGVDTGVYDEDLVVTGDARVTGILTIGTGSIILDPTAKQLRGLEEIVIGIANTITIKQDTKGEIEFTDAKGTPKSVGIGSTVSINTSGIVTATNFVGNLTGNSTGNLTGDVTGDVTGDLTGNVYMSQGFVYSGSTTVTSTSQTAIDTFPAATYRSAKYQVQITRGSEYHITEVYLVHDGTSSYGTEYATIKTGSQLATFDSDIDDGFVRLLATPTSSSSTVFKVIATLTKV